MRAGAADARGIGCSASRAEFWGVMVGAGTMHALVGALMGVGRSCGRRTVWIDGSSDRDRARERA